MSDTEPEAEAESITEPEQPEQIDETDLDSANLSGNGVAPTDVEAGQNGGSMLDFIGGGGIKQMLLQDQYEDPQTGHTYSQADLIADIVNVMRMDAKQIAAIHGIEIAVDKMTPERAAALMQGITTAGGADIIGVFQDIEDKNDAVLQAEFTDEQHEQYMNFKRSMLYSVQTEEN